MGLDRKHRRWRPGKKNWRPGVDPDAAERIKEAEREEPQAPPEIVRWRKQLRREAFGRKDDEE